MTAPTAQDRHAEHERTGQPCNCAGAQPVPTAREIVETAWGPDEHWQDVPLHRLCRIAQASEFALRLLHQAEQRRAAFAEDEATRMACSDCADLRARLAACEEELGPWAKPYETLPGAIRNLRQAEMSAIENSNEAMRQRDAARAALAQAEGERAALRGNVADLTASLRQAQETIRQREAAQRAAEERLETQTQAAYVAQEAQIAQGWKVHDAEATIAALRAALGRYGAHEKGCAVLVRVEFQREFASCTCGLDAAREG